MTKKRKSSPLEDMPDMVSLLPWWAGVAIAVIGYAVLHRACMLSLASFKEVVKKLPTLATE